MRRIHLLLCLCIPLLLLTIAQPVQAVGLPTSPAFGYGATLDPAKVNGRSAIQAAGLIGLDWVSIELHWDESWSTPTQSPNFSAIRPAVEQAAAQNIRLMLAISRPPAWALGPDGPMANETLLLLNALHEAFPNRFSAIELFPGANQAQNWGAPSNPNAYVRLSLEAQRYLDQLTNGNVQSNARVWVVASITPLETITSGDMHDTDFLQALYQTAPEDALPIIGIHFHPLAAGADDGQNGLAQLRHYEAVRQIMLEHQRKRDIIWITSFRWPAQLQDQPGQAAWVQQAYDRLLAQPFIGAAFFDPLCAPANEPANLTHADFRLNPAGSSLQKFIAAKKTALQNALPTQASPIAAAPAAPPGTQNSFLDWLLNLFADLFQTSSSSK